MAILSKLIVAASLVAAHAAAAQPGAEPDPVAPIEDDAPPPPPPPHVRVVRDPQATTEHWGGGVRLTGLSGIGTLPGRALGGEVALNLRHDEYFGELALSRWKPEETHYVIDGNQPTELGLDVWTVRAGWASMAMPLRGWLLAEVGEVGGARDMPGVVARMITQSTPTDRQWRAVGAGFGVAWHMTSQARLVGSLELAVPIDRSPIMLDQGAYTPDPVTARYSLGLEVGWR